MITFLLTSEKYFLNLKQTSFIICILLFYFYGYRYFDITFFNNIFTKIDVIKTKIIFK